MPEMRARTRPGRYRRRRDLPGVRIGVLEYDRHIAAGADVLGTILMLVALFWGGYILYRQYRNLPGKA